MEISKVVQIALLGQVPPTLRFIFASYENAVPNFVAIFDDNATEDHLECARVVCTEVLASCPHNTKLVEKIEIDGKTPWKINGGENLLFLMGTANAVLVIHCFNRPFCASFFGIAIAIGSIEGAPNGATGNCRRWA